MSCGRATLGIFFFFLHTELGLSQDVIKLSNTELSLEEVPGSRVTGRQTGSQTQKQDTEVRQNQVLAACLLTAKS